MDGFGAASDKLLAIGAAKGYDAEVGVSSNIR